MQAIMKDNDYLLFERLVRMTQEELHKTMRVYLKTKYKKVIATKDYIVAVGDIPIALVAHMDTVFDTPVKDLYYDRKKGILWSPDGLGADDRAGVFSIIKIIQSGLRPSIILTTDEEVGGIGASILSEVKCPISGLKYFIQLDRCGTDDCVFYNCGTQDFIDYVVKFGFVEKIGSFSDISYLMPAWERCGVNLSVGYKDEHSYVETLHVGSLYSTIEKVKKMLTVKEIPNFVYEEEYSVFEQYWKNFAQKDNEYEGMTSCDKCHSLFADYELFPVEADNGAIKYFCPDCMVDNVDWCGICGKAYIPDGTRRKGICKKCYAEVNKD